MKDEAMENQRTSAAQLWKMVAYENADLEELGLQKFQKKPRIWLFKWNLPKIKISLLICFWCTNTMKFKTVVQIKLI